MAKEANTDIHIKIYRKLLLKNRIEFVLLLLLTCIETHWNNYAAFDKIRRHKDVRANVKNE